MKGIKRPISILLSVLLLISFSVTLIPLDFLHNHKSVTTTCVKDGTKSACNHKLHVTKKADFCWACAVHYDKTFTITSYFEKLRVSPGLSLVINNKTVSYFIERLFIGLRGPPVE